MANKRYMRKCDTCVGHEARINKLLLKKPPGLMSTSSTSLEEPLRAIKEKRGRREMTENVKNGRRKETNTESGVRHRIFGDGLRSMGSARVGYPTHLAGGMLHPLGLGQL